MKGPVRYLLDSDVLVNSTRVHYHPGFCEAFWDWLDTGYNGGRFFSIDRVKSELVDGKKKDALAEWCKRDSMKKFFLSTTASAAEWGEIAKWVQKRKPPFLAGAQSSFLNTKSADAWLVAFAAKEGGYTIVTNETSHPQAIADIKLPDAAAAQGVTTINIASLLKLHAHKNFTFRH